MSPNMDCSSSPIAVYKYFPVKPIGNTKEQSFYTSNYFDSAIEAQKYLAIPYQPLYRVKIKPSKEIVWGIEGSSANSANWRRVWAAFGYPGGGCESQTASQFYKETETPTSDSYDGIWTDETILYAGGLWDEYCTFIPKSVKPESIEYGSLLYNFLLEKFAPSYENFLLDDVGKERENFGWKFPPDFNGAILYFKRYLECRPPQKVFEYTISVLIRKSEDRYCGIKAWGVFWHDDDGIRTIYKPVTLCVPGLPLLTENEVNSDPYFQEQLTDVFNLIRKRLVDKSNLCCESATKDALRSESYRLYLPLLGETQP